MQTQHSVGLYPRDKAGVDIAKREMSASANRSISKTAAIRTLIQHGLVAYGITEEAVTEELNPKGDKE